MNIAAWIDEINKITLEGMKDHDLVSPSLSIFISNQFMPIKDVVKVGEDQLFVYLVDNISLIQEAFVAIQNKKYPIFPRNIVRTTWFENKYTASETTLGPLYKKDGTAFTLWAPTASNIEIIMEGERRLMRRNDKGVWDIWLPGDLHGNIYQFAVTIAGKERIVNDPYARGLTANSNASVVVDMAKTDPVHFREITYPKITKDKAIIYEVHVRDLSMCSESGIKNKGKFLSFTERHSRNAEGYSTGLAYLKELGITHLQLLPIMDFARVDETEPEKDYNWGYDPLFYFVPEGSYASNLSNPITRIIECKQMIQSIHEAGMSVIIDVVFNHVFQYENSTFEKLVPEYYFRFHENGSVSNGSGTGNDLATERKMARKFILDVVDFWLKEYLVDGFRFDLMGLVDLETMKQIQSRCSQENRPILLLGEGWELDTALDKSQLSTLKKADQLPEVSYFNDHFRDQIKGNTFYSTSTGYVNGEGRNESFLPALITASCDHRFHTPMFSCPLQSVNYVECHDNHTLLDKLQLSNPTISEEDRRKMHQLATGLVLLSQGVPFLHAGQEFFRSKNGDENSYLSGDKVNQMEWRKRGREDENIQWIRKLIQLRKQHDHFRLQTAKEIKERVHFIQVPVPLVGYLLLGEKKDFVIVINPTNIKHQITMPSHGRWTKWISNLRDSKSPISCLLQQTAELDAYELAIFLKYR